MIPVKIAYRPVAFLPFQRKVDTRFPSGWAELSPKQLVAAASIFKESISDDRVIRAMLDIPIRTVRKLTPFQKYRLIELLSFLGHYTPYHEFIIPEVGQLTGPKSRLKDEPFAAFMFAENYFDRYARHFGSDDLCRFIGCFYWQGPFDEKDIVSRAALISKTEPMVLEAIFLNYRLIREWLAVSYPTVFHVAEEAGEMNSTSSWLDVLDAIVGDNIIHQVDYARLPVHTVLRFLNNRIKTRKHGKS